MGIINPNIKIKFPLLDLIKNENEYHVTEQEYLNLLNKQVEKIQEELIEVKTELANKNFGELSLELFDLLEASFNLLALMNYGQLEINFLQDMLNGKLKERGWNRIGDVVVKIDSVYQYE